MVSFRFCIYLLCAALLLIGNRAAAEVSPPEGVPDDAERVTVGSPYVNIYTGPGRGYPIFHVAEYGQEMWLLKRRTDWIKVYLHRNKTGWVRVADLDEIYGADGELVRVHLPDFRDVNAQNFHLGFTYGDFAGADSMGVNLGYRFTANLSAELRATQAVGNFSDSQTYQVAVLHQPFPRWKLSPYFMLGAGVNITSPNATIVATEDRQDTAMLTGLGVKAYLFRRFALRAEYANHYLLTSRDENQEIVEWKLGFDVYL
ncbi:outer membrane beta-barrel protein [Microbulbifer thermotolerans]|uniref:SH3 domain-containing protein n=1 Tax=Microbulbifer thermotolerans TaxID=252514 RepID=A0AB35HXI7_MICTH|nr:outer membrane beta-barrel protein [Microbulbifer thermotolerans]MCX2780660.1 SH3 domain-containing protein [Microbulbifer thermotolerans]MCX2783614.1 SH3 domain-containing protein [Microbulbifer thermotolerans]MCX2795825.1 SH3 domain-containing protein [Microbulbifer thermotolerans]MCX2801989.1 SH3 domain-containing protein [Microbulbifer thermotolerans]MCX2806352.1 SH3 domain-containing protein [Microbulbifer thermotolerans]